MLSHVFTKGGVIKQLLVMIFPLIRIIKRQHIGVKLFLEMQKCLKSIRNNHIIKRFLFALR